MKNERSVKGQKILKSGKLGAVKIFKSISDAARKVAPDVSMSTATSSISHTLAGRQKSAYGYVWSYND